MSTTEEEPNPYELIGVGLEATEAEIKTAYRQRSLKVHPDRNPNNSDAARKFHELNQAYELLLDPLRRMALDAKYRLKEARKARYAKYDAKRKNLVDELEEREHVFKKARVEKEEKQKQVWRDNEKIMEEGRRLREEREKELQKREEEARRQAMEIEPPALGMLDTTVKLRWLLSARPTLTKSEELSSLLAPFGAIDSSDIVISLKPSPPKKPKRGTALIPFKQIGDAFAAVCSSNSVARGLQDVEVSWAEGKEPELIGWLKKMGKLGGETTTKRSIPNSTPAAPMAASISSPFSSFPTSFPELSNSSPSAPPPASSNVKGVDYESLTMMRLRQAERERLEREIREQDAMEE
ncbi:DnaJ domain-containing protein [Irpex rosettiformis]|uniref:DnaJ domain-containing protein n=1 Tax=Irpex rosettiformis TaxID=378272 RepID=A0ACB8U022_9APHY|nr:DnaJ domain-containing protein [Irpex rosettiformis]